MPNGIMVALYLPEEIQKQLAVPGGESPEDLHVTLCYVKDLGGDQEAIKKMVLALQPVVQDFAPVTGRIGGLGRFNASANSDGKDVYYASFNAPVLPVLQQEVVKAIEGAGFTVSRDHGFVPHVTLKYLDPDEPTPPTRLKTEDFHVDNLHVASKTFNEPAGPLRGERVLKGDPGGDSVHVDVPIGSGDGGKKKKKPSDDVVPPPIDNLEVTEKEDGADPATADDSEPLFSEEEYNGLSDDQKLVFQALGFQVAKKDQEKVIKIAKADKAKQIVYGAVLVPDEVDTQGDVMTADEIEKAAHRYMANARKVRTDHSKDLSAVPVESYIAPMDMQFDSPYGPQKIAKGTWILAVKVNDPKAWDKVEKGEYQAFSVGGVGLRDPLPSQS